MPWFPIIRFAQFLREELLRVILEISRDFVASDNKVQGTLKRGRVNYSLDA